MLKDKVTLSATYYKPESGKPNTPVLLNIIYRIEGFGNFNYNYWFLKCISCLLSSFTASGMNPG